MAALVSFSASVSFAASAKTHAAGAPSLPRLAQWVDPTEHAFTVNVPQGWRVTGGVHRTPPVGLLSYVRVESPDGKIHAWINDPSFLQLRQEPTPLYARLGLREGRVVQGLGGQQMLLERFETGARFAQEYAASKVCGAPQFLSAFNLPSATRRLNTEVAPAAAQKGLRAIPSAGEAIYRCGDRFGYTYAATILIGPSRSWIVYELAGYLSDKVEVDEARYVMNSMRLSFKFDRDWKGRTDRQTAATEGALTEQSNRAEQATIQQMQRSLQQNIAQVQHRQQQFDQMTEGSMASFKAQQDSHDRITQRWSDTILGQIHGCDDLGNCAEVSNDYQYYWTKDGKTIVGGPSDGSPPNSDNQYHRWTPDY